MGFYIPGMAPLAVVRPRSAATNQRLLFFAGGSRPLESLHLTWSLLDIAAVPLGIQAPHRLYGFDARGELTAIAGRNQMSAHSVRAGQDELFDWFPRDGP